MRGAFPCLYFVIGAGFVDWAKKQIENYAEMFRNQVFSSDVDQQTVEECVEITHVQSRKVILPFHPASVSFLNPKFFP